MIKKHASDLGLSKKCPAVAIELKVYAWIRKL